MKVIFICYGVLAMALLMYALTGYGWLITIGSLPGTFAFMYYLNKVVEQILDDYVRGFLGDNSNG